MAAGEKREIILVAQARAGDQPGLEELIEKHLGAVHGVALARLRDHEAAQDLVQEVFLRAFLHLEKLREPERFGAWILRIARNLASNWRRDGRKRSALVASVPVEEMEECLPDRETLSARERLEAEEDSAHLRDAVLRLPEELREVVLLHYAEGLSKSEIADRLEVHPSTIGRQIDRALALLRTDFEAQLRSSTKPLRSSAALQKKTVSVLLAAAALSPEARQALAAKSGVTDLTGSAQESDPASSSFPAQVSQNPGLGGSSMVPTKLAALGALLLVGVGMGLHQLRGDSSTAASVPHFGLVAAHSGELKPSRRNDARFRLRDSQPEAHAATANSDNSAVTKARLSEATSTSEMRSVEVLVVNEQQQPVEGAVIVPDGLRPMPKPRNSWCPWSNRKDGPPSIVQTGDDGRTNVPYPRHMTVQEETGGITFSLRHPDYVPQRPSWYLDGSTTCVVLQRGAAVAVSAWLGEPSNRITEFEPFVACDIAPKPEDWTLVSGYQRVTKAVSPGKILVTVTAKDPQGRTVYSDPVALEARGGETHELHLELKPSLTLRGRLSANVPRPVINGRLMANMLYPAFHPAMRSGDHAILHREFEVQVAEDGSFEFKDIPRGPGEIIGLCDGWISAQSDEETTSAYGRNQKFELTEDGQPFELKMNQGARVTATLLDPSGHPIAGGTVGCGPNVLWGNGLAALFLDSKYWQVPTDERGMATITPLPAGKYGLGAWSDDYQLPLQRQSDGRMGRSVSLSLEAGETTEVVLQLMPKGSDYLTSE